MEILRKAPSVINEYLYLSKQTRNETQWTGRRTLGHFPKFRFWGSEYAILKDECLVTSEIYFFLSAKKILPLNEPCKVDEKR